MTFTIPASPAMEQYFQTIQAEIKCCYTKAAEARALNLDPEPTVPIPLAENMAERVVGLISVLAPQLLPRASPSGSWNCKRNSGV